MYQCRIKKTSMTYFKCWTGNPHPITCTDRPVKTKVTQFYLLAINQVCKWNLGSGKSMENLGWMQVDKGLFRFYAFPISQIFANPLLHHRASRIEFRHNLIYSNKNPQNIILTKSYQSASNKFSRKNVNPSSQLIHKSPLHKKLAIALRIMWWIQPSCKSCLTPASING